LFQVVAMQPLERWTCEMPEPVDVAIEGGRRRRSRMRSVPEPGSFGA
jgi:hypothetical protein